MIFMKGKLGKGDYVYKSTSLKTKCVVHLLANPLPVKLPNKTEMAELFAIIVLLHSAFIAQAQGETINVCSRFSSLSGF